MRCFGNMLEALRLEKGLSQADLAKKSTFPPVQFLIMKMEFIILTSKN